jgi:hypothetical protein
VGARGAVRSLTCVWGVWESTADHVGGVLWGDLGTRSVLLVCVCVYVRVCVYACVRMRIYDSHKHIQPINHIIHLQDRGSAMDQHNLRLRTRERSAHFYGSLHTLQSHQQAREGVCVCVLCVCMSVSVACITFNCSHTHTFADGMGRGGDRVCGDGHLFD